MTEPSQKNASRRTPRRTLARLAREESGQDLLEFVLIAAVLALGAISGVASLAAHVTQTFDNITRSIKHDDHQHGSGGHGGWH